VSDALSMRSVPVGDLPFAAPLRAVDEVRVGQAADSLVVHASKRIEAGDPYLEGHFPSLVIYPGVFIVETLRQAIALALDGPAEIARLRSVRFLAPLFADDTLTLEAVVRQGAGAALDVDARCHRGDGRLAARLRLELETDLG
jgi:3-hydroxyacyl-[acyl-carrier-protein] dehydratase